MKVWELIAALMELPAGADVIMSRGRDTFCYPALEVDTDTTDGAWIVGDESETDDPKNLPH